MKVNKIKVYLFLPISLLTVWGCADMLLDSYDEDFNNSVTLWDVEYSIKNTTGIDLSDGGLSGSIPPEIGQLIYLENLNLSRNQLIGSIPLEIGNLANLKYLYLDQNLLTGEIPAEIGELTNLKRLRLMNNQFSGDIPESICDLSNLDYNYNYFGVNLGPYLELEGNQLCPPYPHCISDYMGDQNISNCWDCEDDGVVELWGVCYSIDYTTILDLSNSGLSGIIPNEISNLIHLEELYLNDNQLTGGIPSGIGNLVNLKKLYLNDNGLAGGIPNEIGNLDSLKYLDLSNNFLNGLIPSEIGNLTNLYQLNLSDNLLSGIIPDIICDLELRWYQTTQMDLFGQPVSSLSNNQLCPTYPLCLRGYYTAWWGESLPIVGNQITSGCD